MKALTVDYIIEVVLQYYNTSYDFIKRTKNFEAGKYPKLTRNHHAVFMRQIIVYLIQYYFPEYSLSEIGEKKHL